MKNISFIILINIIEYDTIYFKMVYRNKQNVNSYITIYLYFTQIQVHIPQKD